MTSRPRQCSNYYNTTCCSPSRLLLYYYIIITIRILQSIQSLYIYRDYTIQYAYCLIFNIILYLYFYIIFNIKQLLFISLLPWQYYVGYTAKLLNTLHVASKIVYSTKLINLTRTLL